ncbi:MAG: hypothetical protein M1837_005954 [Sclerophora amabilis]|nr:MAG: hypothetical protein M1837_005954 [Sclerophora amabilis]
MARSVIGSSSDEDDYQAVDQISESEEDEPDVEKVEEKFIIDSEEDYDENGASTLRVTSSKPSSHASSSAAGDWEGFDLDQNLSHSDMSYFDDHFANTNPFLASEIEVFNAVNAFDRDGSEQRPESKRVRFDDSLFQQDASSTTTSSEDDGNLLDPFVPHNRLDPNFRRLIEDDHHCAVAHDQTSPWALPCGDAFGENLELEDSSAFSTLESSSSGYETDEGETTDEDLPPPPTIARTRSVLRPLSSSPSADDESDRPSASRRSWSGSARHRRGPSLGSWVADPSKPIAVLDSTGKRVVIYPAQKPSGSKGRLFGANSSSNSSPITMSPQTPLASLVDDSENDRGGFSFETQRSGLNGQRTNLMMGGLLHSAPENDLAISGQIFGPPEAFYPYWEPGTDGGPNKDGDFHDDEDEAMLNVDDFVDFGDSSSSDEDDNDRDEEQPQNTKHSRSKNEGPISSPMITPSKPESKLTHSNNYSQKLIDHFDRGVVTSFRRNQTRPRSRFSHGRPGLRDNSPFAPKTFDKTSMKGGRFAAIAPHTSIRKRKLSGSITRPLFGFEATRNVITGHKRRRSGII